MAEAARGCSTGWRDLPLCRTYRAAHFGTTSVLLSAPTQEHAMCWVVGMSDGDEPEISGPWSGGLSERDTWARAISELRVRGVEKIASVSRESTLPTGLSNLGTTLRRHASPRLDEVAREVGVALSRAVKKHGAFDDVPSVVDFLSRVLQRAGRRAAASSAATAT